jgi:hypothetical protein
MKKYILAISLLFVAKGFADMEKFVNCLEKQQAWLTEEQKTCLSQIKEDLSEAKILNCVSEEHKEHVRPCFKQAYPESESASAKAKGTKTSDVAAGAQEGSMPAGSEASASTSY